MSTKLIAIGDKKYINPQHIIALFERKAANNYTMWIASTADGGEFVVEDGYIRDLIRALT